MPFRRQGHLRLQVVAIVCFTLSVVSSSIYDAARGRDVGLVRAMVAKDKFIVNQRVAGKGKSGGQTPLHAAALGGDIGTVSVLLEHGMWPP